MKMKRMIPALLLVLCLLTGCGGSSNKGVSMDSAASGTMTAPSAPQINGSFNPNGSYESYDKGWIEEAKPEEPETPAGGASDNSDVLANAKMIYTADLELQTKEFDTANAALSQLVNEMNGYFETRELHQGGTYRSLYCTVRMPADAFSTFLDQAGQMAHLTYRNETSENVSEVYYDLEARLTTQRTKLTRLQELLAEAKNMEDIITLETALSETELQIEYLTGNLRHYDNLIGYSTVHLNLSEVYRLSTEEEAPVTFSDRLSTAFKRGLEQGVENVEDFIIWVARNWLTLIINTAMIAGVVVLVIRLRRKRRTILFKKSQGMKENSDKKDGE